MRFEEIAGWKSANDVDWGIVDSNFFEFGKQVLTEFAAQHPSIAVYGLVARVGQNHDLTIHLNSEEGFKRMPKHFRKMNPGNKDSDDSIREGYGRWAYDYWEYKDAAHQLDVENPSVVHDDCLRKMEYDEDLSERYRSSCARTVVRLMECDELSKLSKTDEFRFRYAIEYDEWGDRALAAARQEIADGSCPKMPDDPGADPFEMPSFEPRRR